MSIPPRVTPHSSLRAPRLDSLKNPQPRPRPRAQRQVPDKCINPDCEDPGTLIIEDNKLVCEKCGVVADDSPDLVTDLQYGVSGSTGQHVVHGHHVGADAAYAHGTTMSKQNRQMSTMEQTQMNGRNHIERICQSLGVNKSLKDAGMQVFRLAASMNFIQGRRTKSVAAVALYIACRTQREEANEFMLIDFADELKLNVFHLGSIYQDLVKALRLNPNGLIINPINPEDLILRFTRRLEFDKGDVMKVASDAVRIVQRMNRDWMTPGRRPAGICGAALILAARMNNYRRTTREMVYVVKVNEVTIFKRLDEFKVLDSSGLTVDEFRTMDLESRADPPAFYQQRDGKKRKKRNVHVEFDDDGDDLGDAPTPMPLDVPSAYNGAITTTSKRGLRSHTNRQLATPPATQQEQNDRNSMPPPPVPIDPSILAAASQTPSELEFAGATALDPSLKPRRGRPRKDGTGSEPADETSITAALTDPFSLTRSALQSAVESADTTTGSADPTTHQTRKTAKAIPMDAEIGDDEFDDDPEVGNCLLKPEEVAVKTQIWTSMNADWIRAQAAKALKHQMAVESGTFKPRKLKPRKRRRMGDLRQYADVLGDGDGDEARRRMEEGEGFDGAASAVEAMMKQRSYSSKINYEALRGAYTPSSGPSSRRSSIGGAASPGSGAFGLSGAASPGPRPDSTEGPRAAVAPMLRASPSAPSSSSASAKTPGGKLPQQSEIDSIVGQLEEEGIYTRPSGEDGVTPAAVAADDDADDNGEDEDEDEDEDENEDVEGVDMGDPYDANEDDD